MVYRDARSPVVNVEEVTPVSEKGLNRKELMRGTKVQISTRE